MRFWDKDFDRWWITWGSYFIHSLNHSLLGRVSIRRGMIWEGT